MSYHNLMTTPQVQDRRRSRLWSTMVPLQAPGQSVTLENASGIISPHDIPTRFQPHFEEDVFRPRSNNPMPWTRPSLPPDQQGAALRRHSGQSHASSNYPGPNFPPVPGMTDYDQRSTHEIYSPTPFRAHGEYRQPLGNVTPIAEVAESAVNELEYANEPPVPVSCHGHSSSDYASSYNPSSYSSSDKPSSVCWSPWSPGQPQQPQ
ncbi:hypothetical protein FB45DRAFT_859301 [Roridomyces roridus]|uniref:Uncharacterized protein n=1 Tax=Roridomyces roridus TaxID=1738132 RepID=A0AAD7CJJ4_9AGAR|nr:hypothetical protein FB45DRAFT_859301 [Roridomyces roridus]